MSSNTTSDDPMERTSHTKRRVEFDNHDNSDNGCAKRGRCEGTGAEDTGADDTVVSYNRFNDSETEEAKDYWPRGMQSGAGERFDRFVPRSPLPHEICNLGRGVGYNSDCSSTDSDYSGPAHLDRRYVSPNVRGCSSRWSDFGMPALGENIGGIVEEVARRHQVMFSRDPNAYSDLVQIVQDVLSAKNVHSARQPAPSRHTKLQWTTRDSNVSSSFQALPKFFEIWSSQHSDRYTAPSSPARPMSLTSPGHPPILPAPCVSRYGQHAWSMRTVACGGPSSPRSCVIDRVQEHTMGEAISSTSTSALDSRAATFIDSDLFDLFQAEGADAATNAAM